MLVYAVYKPTQVTGRNSFRYFSFASVESFVVAMSHYNSIGSSLEPIEHYSLVDSAVSMATLIQYDTNKKKLVEAGTVFINGNTMQDSWDGKHHEIHLVERAADEKVLHDTRYA